MIQRLLFVSVAVFLLFGIQACRADVQHMSEVKTGAEDTEAWIKLVQGKSIGLTANHTTIIGKRHLVDSMIRLHVAPLRIFSPEHGFRGKQGAGDFIVNGADSSTGIPVISLYGKKKKPEADDLEGIDVMIYDIQDVGVRFYTYISTLHYIMEACAERNIPLIILDRPDPLGYYIDGPVLDTAFRSFVGMHPIPVVYGMTPGELAGMINNEGWLHNGIKCRLTVIKCLNYDHSTRYELPVHPSPNLNSMKAVYLYPSICFFEGTIMSLGRGTDFPFTVVGHPKYPDTTFSFKPRVNTANRSPLFKDQVCYGLNFRRLTNNELSALDSINVQWLIDVSITMNSGESFFTSYIDQLAGTETLRRQIIAGFSAQQIRNSWKPALDDFRKLRRQYLLYQDFE